MLSFKDYLIEARMAPLYHGTSTSIAQQILKDNVMIASSGLFDDNVGISFSRSLNYAIKFAKEAFQQQSLVVFEVDQQKLTHNYKIAPVNTMSFDDSARDRDTEFEERVAGSIKNLDKYITKIILLSKPGRPVPGNLILNHPKLFYNGKFVNK